MRGIPVAIAIVWVDNSKFTPARCTWWSWRLRMKILVNSGWILTLCNFSQKSRHPPSWKYATVVGKVVNYLVFIGSNLFSFPPFLCCSLGLWPLLPLSTLPSLGTLSFTLCLWNQNPDMFGRWYGEGKWEVNEEGNDLQIWRGKEEWRRTPLALMCF